MPRVKPKHGKRLYGNMPYSLDSTLIQRVRQYLHELGDAKYVELDELTDYLQVTHREYKHKKKLPFRILVQRAYEYVATEMKDQFATSSSEEESLDEEVKEQLEENSINNSLTELYGRLPTVTRCGDPVSGGAALTGSAPSVNGASTPAVTVVIDRTGDGGGSEPPAAAAAAPAAADGGDTSPPADGGKQTKTPRLGKRKKAMEEEKDFFKKKKSFQLDKSTTTFDDIGGNDRALTSLCDLLEDFLDPTLCSDATAAYSRGVLLHGPPGCGKSLLAFSLAGELELPILHVASTELVSGVSGDSEERIRELFVQAQRAAPCVLFIDEIDALTSKRQNAHKDMEKRIVSQLISSFDALAKSGSSVLVVGATNLPDQIDAALRRAGRFDQEVALGIPDAAGRLGILQVLCRHARLAEDVDLRQISRQTPGCVGADLRSLVSEVTRIAKKRIRGQAGAGAALSAPSEPGQSVTMESAPSTPVAAVAMDSAPPTPSAPVTMDTEEAAAAAAGAGGGGRSARLQHLRAQLRTHLETFHEKIRHRRTELVELTGQDFAAGLKKLQPSSLREGFITVPNVTWADVGALSDVREELNAEILDPVRDPDYYEQLGLTSPSGILLCGPPGCGKTLLAKAVANEAGINFISVKGPELFNMYVGESERAVRTVFARAKNSAPCVIFFDEIDSICQKRSATGDSGSGGRVVNQLLTEMDGMEARQGVYLMAASNRPEIVDPAILRPGRIDKLLYVGLPAAADRADILRAVTKCGTRPRLAPDADLPSLAADPRCEGMTGADLSSLVRQAAKETARERLLQVHRRHFEAAFQRVRPSVRPKERLQYEETRRFCSNWSSREAS
ncbi:nuclear valosin-containing protein-like [Amphibalanus amphitrite]|uniref:nuclear valosin-containing protein-like n=1 Tax=Amphibalanus amphitrite TaxID=1232801 RepID=UPI001C926873|nr:nuclear valosin-containing protein-like [Amphibalanus amphitrite]XP_043212457.1 nuclear valosin-containing protein-like [Amphibalanus amphitrite]XP_043212533.1 nuclear valosin-containing protein-like [Amphibalanus amphitrite]XP_043212613.1 nuclear valosin-containing protein-like [Amphibalanus amphitrite]XP_043212683.1 nuclear valosin-containing protein-like [Amphibalanus amphitrite]